MAIRTARDPTCAELSPVLPRDLARATEWARGHLQEPIRLCQLARVAGVLPRTLEAHFARVLGTTPLGWLRRERLTQARRTLLAGDL